MRRGFFFWREALFLALVAGGLVIPGLVQAADPVLAITEIMYDAPGSDTGREWLELINVGSETVILPWANSAADWRIVDSSSHRIDRALADDWLAPGERLIISDNPDQFRRDYPNYVGDLAKAALNLKNTDATIHLSLDGGVTWDTTRFYAASMGGAGDGRTLEWDGEDGLPSRDIGGTPGAARPPAPSQSVIPQRSHFQLAEVAYNPAGSDAGREWLEVRNVGTTSVALPSATPVLLIIDDGRHPLAYTGPPATIGPGDRVVLTRPAAEGVSDYPADSLILSGAIRLPNRPTRLRLSFDNGSTFVLDETYDPAWGGDGDGRSLEREPAGGWRASATEAGTPGRSSAPAEMHHPPAIVISEVLPAPERGGEEWIELANVGLQAVDLVGWQLDDGRGGSAAYLIPASRLGGTRLEPGQFIVFRRSETRIVLGDRADRVELRQPSGDLVAAIDYSQPPRGASWMRATDGTYRWTSQPTLGKENQLTPIIAGPADSPDPPPIIRLTDRVTEIIDQVRPVVRRLDDLPVEAGWHVEVAGSITESRARSATLTDGRGTITLRFQLPPRTKPSLSAGDQIRVAGIITVTVSGERVVMVSRPTAITVLATARRSRPRKASAKTVGRVTPSVDRRGRAPPSARRRLPSPALYRASPRVVPDSTARTFFPMLGGLIGLFVWGIYATRTNQISVDSFDRHAS